MVNNVAELHSCLRRRLYEQCVYNLRCLSLQYFAIFYMYLHGLYSVLNESLCNKPVRTILIADALG